MRPAVLMTALAALVFAGLAGGLPEISEEHPASHVLVAAASDASREEWRWEQCRFRNLESGPSFSTREIRLTLACATERWTPPRCSGNGCAATAIDKVYAVFGCESGFNEFADNPYSSAAGVAQYIASTWVSVKAHFALFRERWRLRASVFNGRANAILGVRDAAEGGWGPWEVGSCA